MFNIVAEETVSIRMLAEIVTSQLPTEIQYGPARAGDVAPAQISSAKARSLLGWSPATDFKAGLLELIEGYKTKRGETSRTTSS